MKRETDERLRARYRLVFAGPLLNDEPIRCGEGWADLLAGTFHQLDQLIAREPKDEQPSYRAAQIKEKFGGLRIYTEGRPTDAMQAIIDAAERQSFTICDVCGRPGKLGEQRGIMATRCDEHASWTWRELSDDPR